MSRHLLSRASSTLSVVTWNVNSLRARLENVLRFLKKKMPDIVLLQETKVQDEAFPSDPLEDLGYNIVMFGQKSYNGVAILSRTPLEEIKKGLPTLGEGQDARYLEAFTGGLRVASIYVPNGEAVGHTKFHNKERFFTALKDHLATSLRQEEPLIWGGDYNVAPTDTDVYDPKVWRERILCSTPERTWLRSLLTQGLVDPLDQAAEAGQCNPFTWWDYRTRGFDHDRGLRIDHLLLSPWTANRLQKAWVEKNVRGWDKPSDHAPVMLSLAS